MGHMITLNLLEELGLSGTPPCKYSDCYGRFGVFNILHEGAGEY